MGSSTFDIRTQPTNPSNKNPIKNRNNKAFSIDDGDDDTPRQQFSLEE
jgi:hypothetical protein